MFKFQYFLLVMLYMVFWGWTADIPQIDVHKCDGPPVIDGVLSDEAWGMAAEIANLSPACDTAFPVGYRPDTTIKVTWDKDYLYLAFSCIENDIVCSGEISRDGNIYTEDACEFFLDSKGDGRQWYEIQVNPLNQILDLVSFHTGDTGTHTSTKRLTPELTTRDFWSFREWNAKGMLAAVGRIVNNGSIAGWTVEMAIPAPLIMKRYGGSELKPLKLRANFVRYDYYKNDIGKLVQVFMSWGIVQHGCPHISPAAMGEINLVE